MMKNKLLNNVEDFLKTLCPLSEKRICVCLSGGADSTALLSALAHFKDKYSYFLSALHINHLIRGEESFRDENFCVSLCAKSGIELTVRRVDVPAEAEKRKKGLEEAAREVRYEIIKELSGKYDLFATAHNANDNAETVLFNIIRGCAVNGLCGIPRIRDNIIRPLLSTERKDILDYLDGEGLNYVIDSTNLSSDYTRNYIRNYIRNYLRNYIRILI